MKKFLKLTSMLLTMALVLTSCEKEQEDMNAAQTAKKETLQIASKDTLASNLALNGSTTAKGTAGARTITLQTNTLSCPGGLCTSYGVWSTGVYTVWFQMKFNNGFYWSRGGKCGYGILIGDQNTGGDAA